LPRCSTEAGSVSDSPIACQATPVGDDGRVEYERSSRVASRVDLEADGQSQPPGPARLLRVVRVRCCVALDSTSASRLPVPRLHWTATRITTAWTSTMSAVRSASQTRTRRRSRYPCPWPAPRSPCLQPTAAPVPPRCSSGLRPPWLFPGSNGYVASGLVKVTDHLASSNMRLLSMPGFRSPPSRPWPSLRRTSFT
jgi:hypothetical protein